MAAAGQHCNELFSSPQFIVPLQRQKLLRLAILIIQGARNGVQELDRLTKIAAHALRIKLTRSKQ